MPAKSGKQYRFMSGIMAGSIKPGNGPSKAVAREFVEKTPAKKRSEFARHMRSSGRKKKSY
jgi:hypothetical protein